MTMLIRMALLAVFSLALFGCDGGGSSGGSDSEVDNGYHNDTRLLGLWRYTPKVLLLPNDECLTTTHLTEDYMEIYFHQDYYILKWKTCKPTYVNGETIFKTELKDYGSNEYRTGGDAGYGFYENGVLTRELKDIDLIDAQTKEVFFYSMYWTDGSRLILGGLPGGMDCASGSTGEYDNDRCVPVSNVPEFVKIE